jgi:hypothetical protein
MVAVASPIAVSGHRPTLFPWIMLNDANGDDAGAYATGGIVCVMRASAALNIGDAVYQSGVGTVNKSTTAGNQALVFGVVVGGTARAVQSATMEVIQRLGDVGLQAGATNDPVLICVGGICYVVGDSAAAITVAAPVKLSTTTSGRVTLATSGTDAGKILGKAMDATPGAGGEILRISLDLS